MNTTKTGPSPNARRTVGPFRVDGETLRRSRFATDLFFNLSLGESFLRRRDANIFVIWRKRKAPANGEDWGLHRPCDGSHARPIAG